MSRLAPPTDAELNAYLDGELSPQDRASLEAWIEAHPEDARKVAALGRVDEALRARYLPVIDEPVPEAMRAVLAAPVGSRAVRPWLAAAAAVALFVTGSAVGFVLRDQIAAPAAGDGLRLLDGALGAHAVYTAEVRHPVEVAASEEEHLVKWLTKRIGAPIAAPDLTAKRFRLLGGRLLAQGAAPAAQFMYEDDQGRRLTLYIRQTDDAESTAFQFASHDQLSAFYWIDRPLAYALIGPLPREELLPLARLTYEQLE